MKISFYSIIRYFRLKEGIKLEYLAKKMGISKSHLSLIERGERRLSVDDFENALNCFDYEISISKKGEGNMIKGTNEEIAKEGLNLTECGYSKDYTNKVNELIRVEFDVINGKVVIAKDMLDTTRYLSEEKYSFYEEKYDENNDGYGLFYREYYGSSDSHWEVLIEIDKNNKLVIDDKIYEIFDTKTIDNIKNTFLNLDN